MCFGTTWQMIGTSTSNGVGKGLLHTLDNGLEKEKEVRLRLGVNDIT